MSTNIDLNKDGRKENIRRPQDMRFKNWLIHEEHRYPSVAKGPFKLYHGTSTGKNNENVEEFRRGGAKPVGRGWGQGGGFYAWTSLSQAKGHAKGALRGSFYTGAEHGGKPMVVVLQIPEIDFEDWDIDLETHGGDLIAFASRNIKSLQKLGTIPIGKSLDYLKADAERGAWDDHDNWHSVDFSKFGTYHGGKQAAIPVFRVPTKVGTDAGDGEPGVVGKTMGYEDPNFSSVEPTIGNTDALEFARSYYTFKDNFPEKHKRLEALWFNSEWKKSALEGKKALALKYTGSNTLPVKEIYVLEGDNWVEA